MENKMVKAILVMEDGSQKEYEGEGVVICAVTTDEEKTSVTTTGCVHGNFNLVSIVGIHEMMTESFDNEWAKADIIHSMEHIQNMLAKDEDTEDDEDAGTDEEAPESPVE